MSRLVLCISLLGCGLILAGPAASQGVTARIINGQPTSDFAAVGIVGNVQSGGFCTGTLLSPIHVLTAAHCAQFIDGDDQGTFVVDGQTYQTVRIDIHPAFDPLTLENDVAVLELAEPVPDIEPAEIFRGTPLVGDELTIVGFGSGGTATGGANGTFGTKQVGVTFIDDVAELFIYWTFDDANESNTAPGDSGGPGFLTVAGQMYIASITSGGTKQDASLGDMAINARVDTFAAWIDAITMVDVPTDDGTTDDGTVDDGTTDDGSTDDGATDDGTVDDGTTDDGSVDDGAGDDGTVDDGSTDDSSTDDSTTDESTGCHNGPVRQAVREIVASILEYLASDSFVQLLQDLIDQLRGASE